jgi:hypothetical protein
MNLFKVTFASASGEISCLYLEVNDLPYIKFSAVIHWRDGKIEFLCGKFKSNPVVAFVL